MDAISHEDNFCYRIIEQTLNNAEDVYHLLHEYRMECEYVHNELVERRKCHVTNIKTEFTMFVASYK